MQRNTLKNYKQNYKIIGYNFDNVDFYIKYEDLQNDIMHLENIINIKGLYSRFKMQKFNISNENL